MLTYYIVQRGDSLYSIASKFGTTVCVIARLNGLNDNAVLRVGMKLLVPVNNWKKPAWWQEGMVLFDKLTKEQLRALLEEENCRMPRPRRGADMQTYSEQFTDDLETSYQYDDYQYTDYDLNTDEYEDYLQNFDYTGSFDETEEMTQTVNYDFNDEAEPVTPSSLNSVLTFNELNSQDGFSQPDFEETLETDEIVGETLETQDPIESAAVAVAAEATTFTESVQAHPNHPNREQRPNIPNVDCQYYTVQQGDTLFLIARRFNSTATIIKNVNKIKDERNLQVGTVLCVPKSPRNSYIYTVRPGDNINKIADKFGVSADKLIKDNFLNPLTPLTPGMQILIAV